MKYPAPVLLEPVRYDDDTFVEGDDTVLDSPWTKGEVTRDFSTRPRIRRTTRGAAIRSQLLGGPFLAAFDAGLTGD